MPAKATISPGYRWRLGLIALMCLVFAAWFYYDGFVKYPRINDKVRLFQRLSQENRLHEWDRIAEQNGWPKENPGTEKSRLSLNTQKFLGSLCTVIGLVFGVTWLRAGGRWIACDEQSLTTNRGQAVPFDAIRSIDGGRWKTKGIAVVHYDGEGGSGRIVLDDWKYNREATTAIYDAVQAHLNPDAAAQADPDQQPPSEPTA